MVERIFPELDARLFAALYGSLLFDLWRFTGFAILARSLCECTGDELYPW
ncbi:hypothetical protein [Polynucleobacter sp. AM-25C3]|nr:hypothetical protein [Polynucleobacter sp. AM-25C3]